MNNTERFKHIILQHQPSMQRLAEYLLHDETIAEDAVQDALVDLWQQTISLVPANKRALAKGALSILFLSIAIYWRMRS